MVQIIPSVRGVKNWLPGGPADETVCPTFLAVQRFANWVGQAVSPAGPIFHTFSARGRGAGETVPALTLGAIWPAGHQKRSEERRVGKECRSRGAPYH